MKPLASQNAESPLASDSTGNRIGIGLLPVAPGSRRRFLRRLSLGAALFTVPGAFAEELARKTAGVEEGPFYPPNLPLDTDNDLIIVNDSITPAVGEITHVSGRLLDAGGAPIRNATIELWEADHAGVYFADRRNRSKFDPNFQGFGRFLTGSTGEYYFRTIKPSPYAGRPAPHIHFKIKMKGREPWTTQLFVKGFPSNERDGIWRGLASDAARDSVTADFVPVKSSRIGELAARFDIVLGVTPEG
ncbi:MAG TPA: protocatechuate 3,4-dioxygenase [Candidatus Acidoferrum sp.]|jgi:protocatechuate 3,4-dioxygenase beta subunit|nr:protocatechuate 3,4-dioxygenase [Candidatus Acidoferrum sp.]